jgi:hypothetical protein
MLIAPWFCSDRDGEMAKGETLTIAITAPNVPITDRRLNISVSRGSHRATFEHCTIYSFGWCRSRTNSTLHRWFSGFNSIAVEVLLV